MLLLYFIKMYEHVEINMYDLIFSISTSFMQIAAQKIQMFKTIQQSQLTSLCCLYFKLLEHSDLFVANLLTHLMPLDSFCTPWKPQKTKGFLMFSGGIEKEQWGNDMKWVNDQCLHQLTLSWWRFLSYRNQTIDLLCKLMD